MQLTALLEQQRLICRFLRDNVLEEIGQFGFERFEKCEIRVRQRDKMFFE